MSNFFIFIFIGTANIRHTRRLKKQTQNNRRDQKKNQPRKRLAPNTNIPRRNNNKPLLSNHIQTRRFHTWSTRATSRSRVQKPTRYHHMDLGGPNCRQSHLFNFVPIQQ